MCVAVDHGADRAAPGAAVRARLRAVGTVCAAALHITIRTALEAAAAIAILTLCGVNGSTSLDYHGPVQNRKVCRKGIKHNAYH